MRLTLAALACFLAPSALAHAPSTAFVSVRPDPAGHRVEVVLDLKDVALVVPLDADGDGEVTWGELKQAYPRLATYARERLTVADAGETCSPREGELAVSRLSPGVHAVVPITFSCPRTGGPLSLRYDLLFDVDAGHRAILKVSDSAQAVLSEGGRQVDLDLKTPALADTVREFVVQGVLHIWEGFDHMLFLVILLIPAVFDRSRGGLVPYDSLGRAFSQILRIVTAFTVAHSVTLILVTLGYVSLPGKLVESVIAASIIATAANNVWPILGGRPWLVAGGFGLIHGFGFASVLRDLGLAKQTLVPSLLAFNLGVEVGQAVLVAVALPLCFAVRKSRTYQGPVLKLGSTAAAGIAAVWMAERLFEFKILPF